MTREYGQVAADGGVDVYRTNDDEVPQDQAYYVLVRHETLAQNQGLPPTPVRTQPYPNPFAGQPIPPMGVQPSTDPAQAAAQLQVRQLLALMEATGTLPPQLASLYAGTGDRDASLDYIAGKRPDIATFYGNNGWDVSTPEKKRAAVADWVKNNSEGLGTDPIQVARGFGFTPTGITAPTSTLQQRQQEWEQKTRFPWEQEQANRQFGETQREFDQRMALERQQEAERQRQFNFSTLAGLSGPRDWIKYAIAQNAIGPEGLTGAMADLFARKSAWGPMVGTPSWEQGAAGLIGLGGAQTPRSPDALPRSAGPASAPQSDNTEAANSPGATPAQYPNFFDWLRNQPIKQGYQISAKGYGRMSPTERALQEGLWSYQGINPEDAWSQARKSWISSGPVASGTRYRY